VLVIVHFFWARKGNLATLSGDVLLPLTYGLAVGALLLLRLPAVRRLVAARRRVVAPPPAASPDR
jgi:DMSO/TMAO reductase YedYZ heme-binding membrane subunit